MGCGASKATATVQGVAPDTTASQRKATSPSGSKSNEAQAVSKLPAGDDAFDQKVVASAYKPGSNSTSLSPNNSVTDSPSQLSSRRSLTGTSGSLGSKIDRSLLMPAGWTAGKSVIVRADPRTAHICSLACTIVKVPVVLIFTQEFGRTCVTSSKALETLGERDWLCAFSEWLSAQNPGPSLTIEDTHQDDRSKQCAWVLGKPQIQFVMAIQFYRTPDNKAPSGIIVALDKQPHVPAPPTAMLANLANMAAREVEAPSTQSGASEVFTEGAVVPPKLRRTLDNYIWVVFTIDTKKHKWPILYVNQALQSNTGIPPGCLEGLNFWDFILPLHSKEEEPWAAMEPDIRSLSNFYLPPVTLQISSLGSSRRSLNVSKQIYRVEMRPYTETTSTTYEVEPPEFSGQYFACFQPDARFSLDIHSTAPAIPEDLPFPGLELGPVIGKGSFGYVCKGALGNVIVAVKILEADAIAKVSNEGLPMEVHLSSNLRHPNIVKLLDYATRIRKAKMTSRSDNLSNPGSSGSTKALGSGNQLKAYASGTAIGSAGPQETLGKAEDRAGGTMEAWLLMEFCDKGSLQDGMDTDVFGAKSAAATGATPNMPSLLMTAYEIASAMRYLHQHNILHGDLTSGNVLLASQKPSHDDQRGFCAKVADFGLSRESLTSKVETNSFGTVTHMPPELLNDGILSKAADVYAFGVLLVEMYIGERSFTGMRQPQIIHAIAVLKKHPELPEGAPGIFKELANSCMQEEAKERPTFADIMDILRPQLT